MRPVDIVNIMINCVLLGPCGHGEQLGTRPVVMAVSDVGHTRKSGLLLHAGH